MIWLIWYDVIWYNMKWYGIIWYDIWYDMIWYDMIWYIIWYVIHDMIWYDWYDMIWYDMIWYDMIDMIWSDMMWYYMVWFDMMWARYTLSSRQGKRSLTFVPIFSSRHSLTLVLLFHRFGQVLWVSHVALSSIHRRKSMTGRYLLPLTRKESLLMLVTILAKLSHFRMTVAKSNSVTMFTNRQLEAFVLRKMILTLLLHLTTGQRKQVLFQSFLPFSSN